MFLKEQPGLRTVEDLREFIREFFKGKPVKVYLFGSRARGDNSPYSDVDLAFDSTVDIGKELTALKEIIEESSLPYKVDLVELKGAPYLRKKVEEEGIRWL